MTEVEKMAELLGCSVEDAAQVVTDDKRIEKGECLFEQTAEQKANSKKYRQGERKPTVYKLDKRPRKADEDKRKLVEVLAAALNLADVPPTITNPERQIDFVYNDRKFRIVLSAPRT